MYDMEKMTLREVAEFLGVTPQTVRNRIISGQIKPMEPPRGAIRNPRLYFLRADVEKLIVKH